MGSFDWASSAFFGGASFVAFDLETTGLDAKKDRIVEIGAVKFDRRGPAARFSVLINPGIPMPADAERINGISDAMLKDKPSLEAVLPDFIRFIEGSALVAHNAPFDCGFVNENLKLFADAAARRDTSGQGSLLDAAEEAESPDSCWNPPYSSLPHQVVDTRIYAKEAFPGRWKYNLQDLASFLGITAVEAHRAEDDARVCMELFVKCAEVFQGNA
ncbi:3'-5' exonuclease [Breznakiella homolactica]|uniref:3'-5' exonuclease n=1 Tax=Breznakiella homolactica TaxID=2798577 RepID=A0A7T7XLP9_9SPIR|nr:3'-5' exonuclease [Breznakiella homolactica]QQO08558.1 3'-5' exonuclease [Breznakiella homolactica]